MTFDLSTATHLALVDMVRETTTHTPGGEALDRDGILLYSANTDHPITHNGVFRTRHIMDGRAIVEAADNYFERRSRGYTVSACHGIDDDLIEAASAAGLEQFNPNEPEMICTSRPDDTALPENVILRDDPTDVTSDFINLASSVFDSERTPGSVNREVLCDGAHFLLPHMRVMVAYVGDTPVSAGVSRLSHGIAYLFWICTSEPFRRRGIAQALSAELTRQAFDRGAQAVALQASKQGESVYQRIGFAHSASYEMWFRPSPAARSGHFSRV